ncbi:MULTISPECIES: NAD-dependent succinate-semialdehyde dehydrogenase [Bradyrhizobium]|uniref:NAD-dependent succinate-semialdehyde dehydrogenase n=3 Tax=Bradyrhizobium TaxID=374 RepID=A0A410VHV8_9BRAD|nr:MULTISPECIES: NAD-dependent succinate-semialdehyde dehydrogenase [Bradyrhizobium]MCG2633114.1 NAD-dependent succinate-semialdehyde dehydrogenase [Bradyrhizobium zhengyangense]MCG2645701.1 NAD-dependent succinate-semialdehyde dehydrogenase [Bradyrhizobium zhengyangense]MCG2673322.1 NAD-dependent succinate-semialdehyde dehydrogenase [Bradyrhizobium zhengyangense]MDN4988427.1 NAD-dependent succinate-semialdehyde dehydrogenase [Bradyrhizobium sp. WYCCWR 13022]MDT4737835.1 NAD-dependent succinat
MGVQGFRHRRPEWGGLAMRHLRTLRRRDFLAGAAFIDGKWTDGGQKDAVVDPATGEEIAEAARCSAADMELAIGAAEKSFVAWRRLLPTERGVILKSWASLIRGHSEDLAVLMTSEQGKPLAEARYEITYGAGFLEWFAAEGERTYGETIPSHKAGSLLHVRMQPIGVAAAITPWNFPIAMITRKAGAALAAGCPIVVKPAPETPLSALALARLAEEAGIPRGVFQVLVGDSIELSKPLLRDTRVRALSFTGSTEVGRLLLAEAAQTVKKVSLELGGHAPCIIFDDVDVDKAVKGAMDAKFTTSGQDCLAANRIYVHRKIYRAFVEAFATPISQLRVGHGLETTTDIGPMTKLSVANKCRAHIDDAAKKGARVFCADKGASLGANFVPPTLLSDVTDHMLITHEETFGPVAAVLPFDSEAEVVSRANASEMGLAGYIYTNNLRRALRLSEQIECGMLGINTASFTGPPIPFGGWKQSGLGREGSKHGLAEYMEHKYVCFGDLAA